MMTHQSVNRCFTPDVDEHTGVVIDLDADITEKHSSTSPEERLIA